MGDQHGLVVLLFVLGDHPEGETVVQQRGALQRSALQQVEDPAAHLGRVAPGLRRPQQGQLRPLGARMPEGVVERVDLGAQGFVPGHVAQQPELLLVPDVRQVPHQRGHQRGVLFGEVPVAHRVGEQRRTGAGGGEGREGALAQVRGRTVRGRTVRG